MCVAVAPISQGSRLEKVFGGAVILVTRNRVTQGLQGQQMLSCPESLYGARACCRLVSIGKLRTRYLKEIDQRVVFLI